MQFSAEILARLASHLPAPRDIFTDPEKFEEHLFRSGLKPDEEIPEPKNKLFRN